MQRCLAQDEVVILDFETTGLSTDYDRIIEVGAAIVKGNEIQTTFSSLCNPGKYISSFITSLTGITNEMVQDKPSPEQLMPDFYDFIGDRPILAHNASFDNRFLTAEMERAGKSVNNPILCTMLLARRLIDDTLDHKLGTLKDYINFEAEVDHQEHRALDDVKVTASLWIFLRDIVEKAAGHCMLEISDFQTLSRIAKHKVQRHIDMLSKKELAGSL